MLSKDDIYNIKTALQYVIYDMRSDFFKSMFIETLSHVKVEEEKCIAKER